MTPARERPTPVVNPEPDALALLAGTRYEHLPELPPVTLPGPTCGHCGHRGTPADPVELTERRVHDTLTVNVLRCVDSPACWARWDRDNGLIAPDAAPRQGVA